MQELKVLLAGLPDPGGECWVVGGALRDAWLGRPVHDIDLAVPDPISPVVELLERHTGRNAHTVNQKFASARIVANDYEIDITPLNGDSIEADLRRRDYCINALAVPLSVVLTGNAQPRDVIADPNALDDLEAGRLRLVSAAALTDDPLRVLRGFRLAAQLQMEPDNACREAWRVHAADLRKSSGERQREELVRWFSLAQLDTGLLQISADSGVLWQLFPALSDSVGCTQNHYHHLDVWDHTLLALRQLDGLLEQLPGPLVEFTGTFSQAMAAQLDGGASALALTRLSLLLHDVGKPATRRDEADGYVSFIGHQKVGVELVEEDFRRLRFSTAEQDFLHTMIHEHLRLGFYSDNDPLPAKLIYRFIRTLGNATLPQLLHSLADCAAALGSDSEESMQRHIRAARQVAENYINDSHVARPPVLLNGEEIMRLLSLRPGPAVGRYKRAMLEATAEGWISSPQDAREFLAGLAGDTGRELNGG